MRLILLRHAETAWTRTGQHTGRTDLELTLAGETEARASAALIQRVIGDKGPDIVYSSPRRRALRTAELVFGGNVVPRVQALLAEFDYGRYEGLTPAEIRAQAPAWNIWEDGCPEGESIAEVGARADAFIHLLSKSHGEDTVCAVSHGHLLRVLTARVLGLAPQQGQILAIKTTSLAELVEKDGRYVLARWNLTL